jgi:hypothetical protein
MIEGVREQIARTLRELGSSPRGRGRTYQKPYPEYFDTIPYPQGFRVPDFSKFNGDDTKTTYEHIGQFLAQVNDLGITDVHRIRLFPLSLSATAFSWFTSLASGSIEMWPMLEQRFHEYFYNREVELRLSDLTTIRQKYNETSSEYIRWFRETRNKCYNLTIGGKYLADLAFAGLASHLKERMEGQEFTDMNQALQKAMLHENRAREHLSHSRFKDSGSQEREKERHQVNCMGDESTSEDEMEVCAVEWVDMPTDKPISCSFLKHNAAKKDEVKYMFDVTNCDKLFDVLLQGGVIWLAEGHVLPSADQIAKKKYCKWHNSYSHTTNECNYLQRQVQLALNDDCLTLEDGRKMKLDTDPFSVNMVKLGERKILVRSSQASTTKGKNVIVSDELRNRMVKPHSPEVGVWKENYVKRPVRRVKPTSNMLIDKYMRQQQWRAAGQSSGLKRYRSLGCQHRYGGQAATVRGFFSGHHEPADTKEAGICREAKGSWSNKLGFLLTGQSGKRITQRCRDWHETWLW